MLIHRHTHTLARARAHILRTRIHTSIDLRSNGIDVIFTLIYYVLLLLMLLIVG